MEKFIMVENVSFCLQVIIGKIKQNTAIWGHATFLCCHIFLSIWTLLKRYQIRDTWNTTWVAYAALYTSTETPFWAIAKLYSLITSHPHFPIQFSFFPTWRHVFIFKTGFQFNILAFHSRVWVFMVDSKRLTFIIWVVGIYVLDSYAAPCLLILLFIWSLRFFKVLLLYHKFINFIRFKTRKFFWTSNRLLSWLPRLCFIQLLKLHLFDLIFEKGKTLSQISVHTIYSTLALWGRFYRKLILIIHILIIIIII